MIFQLVTGKVGLSPDLIFFSIKQQKRTLNLTTSWHQQGPTTISHKMHLCEGSVDFCQYSVFGLTWIFLVKVLHGHTKQFHQSTGIEKKISAVLKVRFLKICLRCINCKHRWRVDKTCIFFGVLVFILLYHCGFRWYFYYSKILTAATVRRSKTLQQSFHALAFPYLFRHSS